MLQEVLLGEVEEGEVVEWTPCSTFDHMPIVAVVLDQSHHFKTVVKSNNGFSYEWSKTMKVQVNCNGKHR